MTEKEMLQLMLTKLDNMDEKFTGEFQKVNDHLQSLDERVGALEKDMIEVKADVADLQKVTAKLVVDVADLQKVTAGLVLDMGEVKTDIARLNGDRETIFQILENIQEDTEITRNGLNTLLIWAEEGSVILGIGFPDAKSFAKNL